MISGARLTVLGSLNMDISVAVDRLPVPGATVLGGAATLAPGGKGANQAVAAARLGGSAVTVRMVGCVGDDDFGRALRAALRAEGVADGAVRAVPGVATGIAMITVDAVGENTITVAPGANREAGPVEVAAAKEAADVLVISAEVPVHAITAALAQSAGGENQPACGENQSAGGENQPACGENQPAGGENQPAGAGNQPASGENQAASGENTAKASRTLRLLNLAPAPPEAAELVAAAPDWLVVNESEAAAVLGRQVTGLPAAAHAAEDLVKAGARNAVVTAGAAGAAYCGPSYAVVTVPGFPVRAVDTVGAGDTFVGALAVALASGVEPVAAVTAAAAAGATAATRPGTQSGMPRPDEILAATGLHWPVAASG